MEAIRKVSPKIQFEGIVRELDELKKLNKFLQTQVEFAAKIIHYRSALKKVIKQIEAEKQQTLL